ncbi:hypothetical protein [Limnofasciculus baicalensis]|uniref:Uncharacterized protein n=1 Tax=Limnofasciculus baicalensis BBK-W-15 TaxID=2699891 RepID=A0AAE3GUJ6_9CYAN|nr:hypothetical protein [Limnofasciculus baicalensis]MCP2730038.1 hypothetical protein [Limnofasciculus baicalensis BBK-W-15]
MATRHLYQYWITMPQLPHEECRTRFQDRIEVVRDRTLYYTESTSAKSILLVDYSN